MNAVFIATLAGLVTAVCWGTSDYLSARNAKKYSPAQVNFAGQLGGTVLVIAVFAAHGLHITHASDWVRIAISSIFMNSAYVLFVKALTKGAVGILVPLGNIYPLFTILLSLIFLKLHYTALQLGAMLVIVFGAMLLSYEKNHAKVPLHVLHRQTMLALIAAVVWGIGFFVLNPVVSRESWQSVAVASEIFSWLCVVVLLLASSGKRALHDARMSVKARSALAIGFVGQFGYLALLLGSGRSGSVVIPAVLSACGPLVASLWGRIFDNERVGIFKRLGAALTVLGVIVLNLPR